MSSSIAVAVQSDSMTIPPTTFPLFPRLPPELRTMIWKLALYRKPRIIVASKMSRCDFEKEPVDTHNVIYGAEHGRVVEVLDTSHRILVVDPRGQINAVGCTWDVRLSDHEIPTPLLHTCQESRQQALKIYEVSFKGLESSLPGSSVAKYIYFDWNRDELMVDDARAWESFCGKDTPVPNDEPQAVPLWFSKIQHLKVSCGFKNCIKLCEDRLTELAALKTLSILGHRCPAHRGTQRPCSSVARREAKFTERLESKWEQELGQESKKSLPKIAFISWSDFFAENISRNKIDFQAPRRRDVALWEYGG